MNENYLFEVYVVYSVVAVALTIWLARTLFRTGAVFLADVFADRPELAQAVNQLLVVGFYLLNLGYAFYMLKAEGADTSFAAMEVLGQKLGFLLLSLGAIHFGNLYLFHHIRQRSQIATMPPPVSPHMNLTSGRTSA